MDEARDTRAIERNLLAWARAGERAQDRARRLAFNADGSQHRERDGSLERCEHLSWYGVDLADSVVDELVAPLDEVGVVLCFGVGGGETVRAVLRERPRVRVVAWDRDAWYLQRLLEGAGLEMELATGRLELAYGADLLEDLSECSAIVRHPILAQVYKLEERLLEADLDQHRAAVGLGGLFVEDLAQGLRDAGYLVVPIDLTRWSRDEIRSALIEARAQFVATINHFPGLDELTEELEIPLMVWEIDPALDRPAAPQGTGKATLLATWRKRQVAVWEAAGWRHVLHLPLAAEPRRRHPPKVREADDGDHVVFVGSSLQAEAERDLELLKRRHAEWAGESAAAGFERTLEGILHVQERSGARWVLGDLLRERLGPFLEALEVAGCREDPEMLLGETAAARWRARAVAALAAYDVEVWGDEGWTRAGLPGGVHYRGLAGHGPQLTGIYGRATINVDIGRLYQGDIITMRVFDVLACGGFVLAEHSEELKNCLRIGREVETWRTPEELAEKVGYFLENAAERQKIARAGRIRVLRDHNVRQRVQQALGEMERRALFNVARVPGA